MNTNVMQILLINYFNDHQRVNSSVSSSELSDYIIMGTTQYCALSASTPGTHTCGLEVGPMRNGLNIQQI